MQYESETMQEISIRNELKPGMGFVAFTMIAQFYFLFRAWEKFNKGEESFSFVTQFILLMLVTIGLAVAAVLLYHYVFKGEEEKAKYLGVVLKWPLSIGYGALMAYTAIVTTSNLIYFSISLTFLIAIHYYLMTYGEVMGYFENRVVIFTVRRILAIIPMFLAIAAFAFFSLNLLANPVKLATAMIRTSKAEIQKVLMVRWGLAYPPGHPKAYQEIPVQERFVRYLNDFIHGDLGVSFANSVPVVQNIGNFLWETLKMQITSLILAFFISITLGILAAYFHRTVFDSAISSIALIGLSMPIFVSGLLAIIIFGGAGLGWLPSGKAHSELFKFSSACTAGAAYSCDRTPQNFFSTYVGEYGGDPEWRASLINLFVLYTWDSILHLILPVATLTFATMATFARLTRGEMLNVLRQDYILAARANGLAEKEIIRKHAMKNVMLPLLTFLGLSIGGILAGAPITETVFAWPGLGKYYVNQLTVFDYPVVVSITMIITLMTLFSNLIVDILYTLVDPRISL